MNKENLKKSLYTLGKILGIAGLVFVFYKLFQEYTLSTLMEKLSYFWYIIIPLILINLLSLLIGIYGWHLILKGYIERPLAYTHSYYFFAKTEIAKYLPGNIFHLVGRQALASEYKITQGQMAKTSVLHAFSLLVATLISATLFSLFVEAIPLYLKVGLILASIISLAVLLLVHTRFSLASKLWINVLFIISITLQGILLAWIVLYQLENISWQLFCQVSGIYIISWLVGFVTPGASGGLGVREGTFVAIASFLQLNIASDIIIFSVLLVRLINILVDILMYISTLMRK